MPLYLYTFKGLQKVKFISLKKKKKLYILKFEILAGIQQKV